MNDEHAAQIVRAIREHTRAVVAGQIMAGDRAGEDMGNTYHLPSHAKDCVRAADALLAALSASSGGENDAASGEDVASGVFTRSQNVSGHREPAVASEVNPSETQAATPPLSADLVTVRRDDLEWAIDWIDTDDPGACQRRQRLLDCLR